MPDENNSTEPLSPEAAAEGSHGYIIVNVRTANGAIPIEGAMVTLTDSFDNHSSILGMEYSDSSGTTPKLKVGTPPLAYSQVPLPENVFAYSKYNIRTDKEGYYSIVVIDVSVFPQTTSIQDINMLPLMDNAGAQSVYNAQKFIVLDESRYNNDEIEPLRLV